MQNKVEVLFVYNILSMTSKILFTFIIVMNGPPGPSNSRIIGHPDQISQAYMVPPATDGLTLSVVFCKCLGWQWARKDEAVYAVSLRLGFQDKLNNCTLCTRVHIWS